MNNCKRCFDFENHNFTGDEICKIEEEWHNFLEDRQVNINIIPSNIHESWKRSREKNINLLSISNAYIINKSSEKELINYYKVINTYGDILDEIKQIANINEFTLLFCDEKGRTGQIKDLIKYIVFEIESNDVIGIDTSEKSIGTSSITETLVKKRPVKFLGNYHYTTSSHKKTNVCTAPVFDINGKIKGVLAIPVNDYTRLNEAFALVISLAKLFEAKISLRSINEKMQIHELVLKNIIEAIPRGMAYLNKDNKIKFYNEKILDILKVNRTKNIKVELNKYMPILNSEISAHKTDKIINIEDNNKPILVSHKEILNNENCFKDKIIFLEERKNNIIAHSKICKSNATYTFTDIVGKNLELTEVKALAMKVAKTSVPVLILGESGTGKELFAQSIHNSSLRKDGPFIAINCGAIPSELIESELFGYEEGSFTGAIKGGKKGKLEAANCGTLFLDEIESMPLNVQIKLLRTLSAKTISKIGGTKEILIDIRIISATKKNLLKEADKDRFRDDLYYRISTFTLELPPLRERRDDIMIISKYFIDKFSTKYGLLNIEIHEEFSKALSSYYWRGNIRELENVIERAIVLLGHSDKLTLNHLPKKILKSYIYKNTKEKLKSSEKFNKCTSDLLNVGEEIIIESVLMETNWSIVNSSKILGISRQTLNNKINGSERLTRVKKSYKL